MRFVQNTTKYQMSFISLAMFDMPVWNYRNCTKRSYVIHNLKIALF